MSLALVNIGELATCPPGNAQDDAGLIRDAALVVGDGRVDWCGPAAKLPDAFHGIDRHDCDGALVIPGLVDCHTHLCFGGWRGDEFEMRLRGMDYREIAAAGGGIIGTVEATRAATKAQLLEKARNALDGMLALGVTTVECKSGYGLDVETELKQLEIYRELGREHVVTLVPTFLGAHIVPPEYATDRDGYVELLCDSLLPKVARRGLAGFCDVFVEAGAFTAEEARRILSTARDLGLGLKVHADQLSDGGGAQLAAELGAISAEHLEYVSAGGITALAAAGTVAVSLPLASLYLGEPCLPARELLRAGVPVAVATDFNPGSALMSFRSHFARSRHPQPPENRDGLVPNSSSPPTPPPTAPARPSPPWSKPCSTRSTPPSITHRRGQRRRRAEEAAIPAKSITFADVKVAPEQPPHPAKTTSKEDHPWRRGLWPTREAWRWSPPHLPN